MRRSKIMMACWIVVAVFLGSCDRSPEAATELKAALALDPKFPGADVAKKTLEALK